MHRVLFENNLSVRNLSQWWFVKKNPFVKFTSIKKKYVLIHASQFFISFFLAVLKRTCSQVEPKCTQFQSNMIYPFVHLGNLNFPFIKNSFHNKEIFFDPIRL
jgi:hypothetical protein